MNQGLRKTIVAFAAIATVGAIGSSAHLCAIKHNYNNRLEAINTKLDLYKTINGQEAPLLLRYKLDLYKEIEEKTGFEKPYNANLTSAIQRTKMASLRYTYPQAAKRY